MKKTLFAVALAVILLATNCQKTEIMNQTGTSIGFDSQIGKLTKAVDEEGLDTLKANGFRIWAYRNFTDEYFTGVNVDGQTQGLYAIYDGMEALPVTWDGSNWGTKKDYYWPGANKTLKFFAVSCNEDDFSLAPGTNAVTPNPANESITVNSFEVKEDANNDLMVADVITQGQTDPINGNTVKPVFRHTLTKVQFNFNTDKNTVAAHPVYVQSITTSELKNVGTLTLPVPSEEVTSPWSGSTGEIKYTDDNDEDITLPNKKDEEGNEIPDTPIDVDGEPEPAAGKTVDRKGLTLTEGFQTLDTWLLLPQDISTATVTINYIIKDRWFTKTYPLYTDGLQKWDHNQFVKYNVTIAPNLITFTPTVEQWETTNATMNDNGTQLTPNTPTTTEKTYSVKDGENTDVTIKVEQVGEKPAVGETASPNGTYTMEDGSTIVITDGKIASITPASQE